MVAVELGLELANLERYSIAANNGREIASRGETYNAYVDKQRMGLDRMV